ncbi:efflux RND transporter periplasmic adaptor subunit [Amycolatopsis pithecellobii]|uniref:efflux RND transporter periplasmic adaptor subunit n=1 Tax=Amycolatopsis pithecellobii TaxID=664692 RepID=UPI001AA09AF7|nr:efflux RND transporter periplasmic adaptor subunit [Amycolatopsis pithecellobii]
MLGRLRKKRRWVYLTVAVVVLVAAGVTVWEVTRPAAAPSYRLVAANTTTLRQTVSSTGTIEPAQRSDLNFGVAGQVTAVDVTVGQQVTAGQPLATLQSASLAASVAQAKASVASGQAKLSADQSNSASSAQISADQASITAAQNQLDNAQSALSAATMTSPIAGTVAAVNLSTGQQVSAGGTGSTAQIVVMSTGSYVVNASVDDTQIGQIKTGEQAVITPDGSANPIYGTVTSVAVMPAGSSSVPSYPVTIGVTGSPPGLFAGASASVAIVVKQLTDVLAVPAAAVHYGGGQATVDELVAGKQTSKQVQLGQTANGMVQVLSGLSEGDQVMVTVPAGTTGGTGGTGGAGGRNGGFGGPGGFGGGARTGGLGGGARGFGG